jgi:hypothetical protein
MGEVVFWTIMRTAIVIPIIWFLRDYIDFQFWWSVGLFIIYGVIIHPAVIHYNLFKEKNKDIIESTLCSSCKHFDESAVLCMLYDKHPTKEYLPCAGVDWEPKSSPADSEDLHSGRFL